MSSKSICTAQAILQEHLYSLATTDIAQALQIDPSAVSRIKTGERGLKVDEIIKMLAIPSKKYPHGLTFIASNGGIYVSKDELSACRSLAKKYLDAVGGETL